MQRVGHVAQAIEVLSPIEIAVHENTLRMLARELVEVGDVIGVRRDRLQNDPRDAGRDSEATGDFA